MYSAYFNQYKGNVGVYIFTHEGVEWGLELCHLNQQPAKGVFSEGDVIAHSGNTGSSTTGAHLHAVLHRDAFVTKNYSELTSRDAFLRLESEGRIVDCFSWFKEHIADTPPVTPVEPTPTPTPEPEPTPTPSPSPTPQPKPSTGFLASFFNWLKSLFGK